MPSERTSPDYARILANDLFSTDVILEPILQVPTSDRIFAVIGKEVSVAFDAQIGFAQPLISFAIGTKRNLIVDTMNKLSPEQYESILWPVFKDDEMLVVMVGAVLGFLVGELQVVLVEHFSHAVH